MTLVDNQLFSDQLPLRMKIFRHSELVERAARWLVSAKKCLIIASEIVTINHETPDAIGFTSSVSYLVECKTNRSDFISDGKKMFRKNPELGLGFYRYYMCPPGIIQIDDLPEKWGLLWVYPKQIRIIHEVDHWKNPQRHESFIMGERRILYSLMRRAIIRDHAPKIWRGGE